MTIDEAIKTLEKELPFLDEEVGEDFTPCVQLGIEALKEIKAARSYSVGLIPEKLPGETDA